MHLDRGGPIEDVDRDVAIVAAQQDVEARARHLEIPQPDPFEPGRQPRMAQLHARRIGLDLETEGGRERRRQGRGGPGLRRAGTRIGRGPGAGPAAKAAEELGQPAQLAVRCGIEQRLEQPDRRLAA